MVTATLPHIQVTASGTLGGDTPNEIWTFGYKIGVTAAGSPAVLLAPSQTDLTEVADLAVTSLSAFIASHGTAGAGAGSIINDWVTLNRVDAAAVDATGKRPDDRSTVIRDIIGVKGGAPATSPVQVYAQTPYQVAVVATLRGTSFTRGPAAYGRFYIPGPNLHCGGDTSNTTALVNGLMQPIAVQAFANAATVLVQAQLHLSADASRLHRVWNVSASTATGGIVRAQPVTKVSVDNRPDTVRRRSNRLSGEGTITETIETP